MNMLQADLSQLAGRADHHAPLTVVNAQNSQNWASLDHVACIIANNYMNF